MRRALPILVLACAACSEPGGPGDADNQAPEVEAGADRTVAGLDRDGVVSARVSLDDATARDEGGAGELVLSWSLLSGPPGADAAFEPSPSALHPEVFLSGPAGEWILELAASDGELEARDTVSVSLTASPLPSRSDIVRAMRRVNDYWLHTHPAPGDNRWERAAYFEGNMAMHQVYPEAKYLDYAVRWGEANAWALNGGASTRHADNHCAGQTYIDLYRIDPRPERIAMIESSLEAMLASDTIDDWWWVDALQMAMPVFARLGALRGDPRYSERLHEMYDWTRRREGGGGLYNPDEHLWWRDENFKPPATTPGGEDIYWSRGNGWAIAAHVRTLAELPADDPHRGDYESAFVEMAAALAAVQRPDGFWNSSLHDPADQDGPETSGTGFITYGLAWGVRTGLLDQAVYVPVVARGWRAMTEVALHPDGRLGYIQPVGASPRRALYGDHHDFGVGAFLLAASEVLALAPGDAPPPVSEMNAALGRPVVASSEQAGNEGARAVDGDDFTRWSAEGFPQAIEVDLGGARTIRAIELAPLGQRPYRFTIETRQSPDEPWQLALDDSANDERGPLLERAFAPRTASHLRLTVTGVAGAVTDWVSILELRVLE